MPSGCTVRGVFRHNALAKDVGPGQGRRRGRGDANALVIPGQVGLQEGLGGDRPDPRQPPFLHQAVLQRPKQALDPPLGLRRVRMEDRDAQLRHRALKLALRPLAPQSFWYYRNGVMVTTGRRLSPSTPPASRTTAE